LGGAEQRVDAGRSPAAALLGEEGGAALGEASGRGECMKDEGRWEEMRRVGSEMREERSGEAEAGVYICWAGSKRDAIEGGKINGER
jgi:hypothetical protein